jgi:hypothetical protein
MNAFAPLTEGCPECGAAVPSTARFCPDCGTALGAPRPEGDAPISYRQVEPRWFGVAPPRLLLGIAVVALVLALVLFATGHWPYGLILLGIGALLLAAFLEAARRRPERHSFITTSAYARERAHATIETLRARSAAAAEVKRIRHGLVQVEADRRTALLELGAAAHGHDGPAEAAARARHDELDSRGAELRGRLDGTIDDAGERIRKARMPVENTMIVLPSEPFPPPGEADPPQPAVVPEPFPPPGEADPPQPAVVPEPYPPPDETDLPQPEPPPGGAEPEPGR